MQYYSGPPTHYRSGVDIFYGFASGHFRRDLVPTTGQLASLGRTAFDHLRLNFHQDDRYNVLQRPAYLSVIIALSVTVLAGLAMSPAMDVAAPWLVDLFGGRQSARTVHFILAWLLVAFAFVHIVMVVLSGPWRNLSAMVTGWYRVKSARGAS